jgi:hypothetical protein
MLLLAEIQEKKKSAKQECVGMQEDKKEEMDYIGRSDDNRSVGQFSAAGQKPTPVRMGDKNFHENRIEGSHMASNLRTRPVLTF